MKPAALFGMLGAVFGFLGVAAGAFGAHALRDTLPPERLQVFETGARYQLIHALALVAVALALDRAATGPATAAGWLFVLGQVIFAGSLYALALSGVRLWGAVTPLGGLCYLGGWAFLAWSFARR
ncbi:MAG TPA: DUF423 domain-containing protein [Candidatus Binatia bacterium]|nr:DUF423 domain-containing protein [Candidatus Binatia bacterium]